MSDTKVVGSPKKADKVRPDALETHPTDKALSEEARKIYLSKPQDFTNKEALCIEYQAAQASAEHHDSLVWTVTSILWAATLLLLGFVLENLGEYNLRPMLTWVSMLNIFLISAIWLFTRQFRSMKNQKYDRCKIIERQLGIRQHLALEHSGRQKIIYAVLTGVLIFTWFLVLVLIYTYPVYGLPSFGAIIA